MEAFMEQSEFEFSPRRVDELFERRSNQEITDTIAGMDRAMDGSVDRSRFSNTAIAIERLIGHPEYRKPVASDVFAPYGRFRGRHIIGTGTRVLGGVYLGHRSREAIVTEETSPVLQAYARRFFNGRFEKIRANFLRDHLALSMTEQELHVLFLDGLPQALFEFTKSCLPYNEQKTAMVSREAKIEPDAELSLDVYLLAQTGVCRHMVLFLVSMFELLSQMGLTQGTMSVCRCYIPNLFSHAWARFEQEETASLILDPAQDFCGSLENGGEMGKFVYAL